MHFVVETAVQCALHMVLQVLSNRLLRCLINRDLQRSSLCVYFLERCTCWYGNACVGRPQWDRGRCLDRCVILSQHYHHVLLITRAFRLHFVHWSQIPILREHIFGNVMINNTNIWTMNNGSVVDMFWPQTCFSRRIFVDIHIREIEVATCKCISTFHSTSWCSLTSKYDISKINLSPIVCCMEDAVSPNDQLVGAKLVWGLPLHRREPMLHSSSS